MMHGQKKHQIILQLFLCSFTPWNRVIMEKLKFPHLVKKFMAFYGTQNYIVTYTIPRNCPYDKPN